MENNAQLTPPGVISNNIRKILIDSANKKSFTQTPKTDITDQESEIKISQNSHFTVINNNNNSNSNFLVPDRSSNKHQIIYDKLDNSNKSRVSNLNNSKHVEILEILKDLDNKLSYNKSNFTDKELQSVHQKLQDIKIKHFGENLDILYLSNITSKSNNTFISGNTHRELIGGNSISDQDSNNDSTIKNYKLLKNINHKKSIGFKENIRKNINEKGKNI